MRNPIYVESHKEINNYLFMDKKNKIWIKFEMLPEYLLYNMKVNLNNYMKEKSDTNEQFIVNNKTITKPYATKLYNTNVTSIFTSYIEYMRFYKNINEYTAYWFEPVDHVNKLEPNVNTNNKFMYMSLCKSYNRNFNISPKIDGMFDLLVMNVHVTLEPGVIMIFSKNFSDYYNISISHSFNNESHIGILSVFES